MTFPLSKFLYGSYISVFNLHNNLGKVIPSRPEYKAERILESDIRSDNINRRQNTHNLNGDGNDISIIQHNIVCRNNKATSFR